MTKRMSEISDIPVWEEVKEEPDTIRGAACHKSSQDPPSIFDILRYKHGTKKSKKMGRRRSVHEYS